MSSHLKRCDGGIVRLQTQNADELDDDGHSAIGTMAAALLSRHAYRSITGYGMLWAMTAPVTASTQVDACN
jgi:hypothetical protein